MYINFKVKPTIQQFVSAQDLWADECKGSMQSPINIDTKLVSGNKSMEVKLNDYDLAFKDFKVINTGYTSQLRNHYYPGIANLIFPKGAVFYSRGYFEPKLDRVRFKANLDLSQVK